jgi:hypothetical protein
VSPRTEAEWRELAKRLKEIANDRDEERVRRQRALAILESIPREYRSPAPREPLVDFDMPLDGQIV